MQCSEEATEKDDHPDEPTNAALRAPGMIQSSNTLVNNKLWERRTILLRKIRLVTCVAQEVHRWLVQHHGWINNRLHTDSQRIKVQRPAKFDAPGCVRSAGKLRQK